MKKLVNSLLRYDIDTLIELKDNIESVTKVAKEDKFAILIKFKNGKLDAYYIYLSSEHRDDDYDFLSRKS